MKLADLDIQSIGTTKQIVGVVYQGDGKLLLLPFPGESDTFSQSPPGCVQAGEGSSIDILAMDLGEWQRFIQQTDRVEVMAKVVDEHGVVGKSIVRKSSRQISQNVSWAVYRRDHYRCRYCGTNDVPLTVDHLVLWTEGGPSTEDNLLSACKKCNRKRGETPYHVWIRSAYYRKVSRGIPPMIQEANENLAPTLARIPRHPLKGQRKRR
tara:strand:+ start:1023 stop:1649 length:627 start_codon:yes stop_codon:yes gene_type:complete